MNPRPIVSVDVPIYAHRLREGTLGETERDALHSLLYSPHIHRILESHLDDNSPLWSATRIYIQVQRLRTLLDLVMFPLLALIICAKEVLTPLTELDVPLPRDPPPPLQTSTMMT